MRRVLLTLMTTAAIALTGPAWAGDEELCLDCHEPVEDWEGMSPEEILQSASDASIKRHADNQEFSEEQLKAIIAALLADS